MARSAEDGGRPLLEEADEGIELLARAEVAHRLHQPRHGVLGQLGHQRIVVRAHEVEGRTAVGLVVERILEEIARVAAAQLLVERERKRAIAQARLTRLGERVDQVGAFAQIRRLDRLLAQPIVERCIGEARGGIQHRPDHGRRHGIAVCQPGEREVTRFGA